ncbi:hypothetical protein L3Y34_007680 [Caenorhabditis briggsae]|uniref:C6 domain-containing protein n=1 Tax=Caenorhabditis briggsae TaxID=6238 RepID=A0AAE9A0I4_CAEBR|nr:hypothetical protein L3Y34_007680 [Caenorhabditis briggsae]
MVSTIFILFVLLAQVDAACGPAPTAPPTSSTSLEFTTTLPPTTAAEHSTTTIAPSTTMTEIVLNTCSPKLINYVPGDNNDPQGNVDVTYGGFTSTRIPDTLDSISTLRISCSGDDGYIVNMEFNENGQAKENLDEVQRISINVTCDSREMNWIYTADTPTGGVFTHTITSVECLQVPR